MKKLAPIILAAICAAGMHTMASAFDKRDSVLYYKNENGDLQLRKEADINIEPMNIIYDGKVTECDSFKSKELRYVQLRQLAELTGRNISFNPITNSVYITDGVKTEHTNEVNEGLAKALLCDGISIYYNDKLVEFKNQDGGTVYNVNGYLYCKLSDIADCLQDLDESNNNKLFLSSESLVRYESPMGFFFEYGGGNEKLKGEISDKEITQKLVDEAKKLYTANVSNIVTLDAIKTRAEVFAKQKILVVNADFGFTDGTAVSTSGYYMILDGTEGAKTLEKGNLSADKELIPIDVEPKDIYMYFINRSFDYTGSALTEERIENAKSMSRAVYDSEYKVLEQWSVPFIYESNIDKQIYEVVLVENLIEAPDGSKCLKESFFKVKDFVNNGNKL